MVLNKNMLSSLLTYFIPLLKVPICIDNRLNKIQRDFFFFWGGGGGGELEVARKLHLVDWRMVCSLLKKGGLGIRKMSTFNETL